MPKLTFNALKRRVKHIQEQHAAFLQLAITKNPLLPDLRDPTVLLIVIGNGVPSITCPLLPDVAGGREEGRRHP
jgi:hypothetical protein